MEELIREIRRAVSAQLYVLALMGALALIDICGALASEKGAATPSTFKDWLRNNVPEQAGDADLIYGLRCSLLHQGRAHPHGSVFPMAFTAGTVAIHNVSTVVNGQQVGWCHIDLFVEEVTNGAERWYGQYKDTNRVERNLEKFARVRPEGLPPHVVGRPVIA